MIDHAYNAFDDKTNEVQYFDVNGKMVARYPMLDFQQWADKKLWDMSEEQVNVYLDDNANWIKMTTEFYNSKIEAYPFGHKQGFTHIQKVK